jgi:protein O-GlcNAc transferase
LATIQEALAIAVSHHQAGRLQQAEQIYRQILQADPHAPDALHLLGVVANQTGHHAAAVDLIRSAIAISPHTATYHNNLGLAYRALKRPAEAIACYQSALHERPDYAEASFNLGITLRDQGNLSEAIACYRQAIQFGPDFVDAHNSLGVALKEAGQLDEAAACYRRALELKPDFAEVHYNLGSVLNEAGKTDEAIACYQTALRLKPNYAEAHCNLGLVLAGRRDFNGAMACYLRAIRLRPEMVEAHNNLGSALASQGKFVEAAACFRRVITLKPAAAGAYCSLGDALRYTGGLAEAVDCFKKDLELRPNRAETYNLLGNALKEQGRLDEALAAYRQAMRLNPDLLDPHTNFLLASHYRLGVSSAELARLHVEWDDRHAAPLRSTWRPHSNSRQPERPLRLGFLSADFGFHPVGYFLVRTLENLDPRQCEVVCYSDRTVVDHLTSRFQAAATTWREVSKLSDEELAEQVRADNIDILFELAGHTFGSRLLVFARKPAPIQISWIGYEGTTGLRAIDYLLADRHIIPPGAESDYPERILRLPDSYVCYDPPSEAPAVGPLPAQRNGCVTLASFNNPAKLNAEVIDVWAEILRRLPRAKLVLKYNGLDDDRTRQRLRAQFVDRGLSGDRIALRGWSSFSDLLAEYNQVDIALDPFPFSGGATTCNALWMGVPVITWPGNTFASRHGLSYLSGLGLTETIARDRDQYIRLTVSLAEDLDRLAALRLQLRPQMSQSPLCDGRRHAENLQQILRDVWRTYCASP